MGCGRFRRTKARQEARTRRGTLCASRGALVQVRSQQCTLPNQVHLLQAMIHHANLGAEATMVAKQLRTGAEPSVAPTTRAQLHALGNRVRDFRLFVDSRIQQFKASRAAAKDSKQASNASDDTVLPGSKSKLFTAMSANARHLLLYAPCLGDADVAAADLAALKVSLANLSAAQVAASRAGAHSYTGAPFLLNPRFLALTPDVLTTAAAAAEDSDDSDAEEPVSPAASLLLARTRFVGAAVQLFTQVAWVASSDVWLVNAFARQRAAAQRCAGFRLFHALLTAVAPPEAASSPFAETCMAELCAAVAPQSSSGTLQHPLVGLDGATQQQRTATRAAFAAVVQHMLALLALPSTNLSLSLLVRVCQVMCLPWQPSDGDVWKQALLRLQEATTLACEVRR